MFGSSSEIVTVFLVSSVIILLMIAGIAIFMVAYQRRLVQQRLLLQRQELDYQQQVLTATVQSQERERFRIGKDLHDEVGAMLSALKMNLHLQDRRIKSGKLQQGESALADARQMLDETISNVRQISHELLPPSLESLGLAAAARTFCEQVQRLSGIPFAVHFSGEPYRLTQEAELAAYRVIQELSNNSLKHAEAHQMKLAIQYTSEACVLTFEDDGKGFDYSAVKDTPSGMGLLNIGNRIKMAGGTMEYASSPGKGVQVSIRLPNRS